MVVKSEGHVTSSLMSGSPEPRFFPSPETASDEGLVCFGGRLSVEWLIDAYSHGIFPWPIFDQQEMMAWWSPDPRGIIEFDRMHVSRRLRRTCRSGKFELSLNEDFAGVIEGCAQAQDRCLDTWLTDEMILAYRRLHELGLAHSVEAWHEDHLAGGIYGVALGGLFAAESMFYQVRDASKVALVQLIHHLRIRGYTLLDVQLLNPHTKSLGGMEIPRSEYLRRLSAALSANATIGERLAGDLKEL